MRQLPTLRIQDEGRKEVDLILSATERKIYDIYRRAAISLRNKAERYFRTFQAEDQQRAQAVADGRLSAEDYARWRISHMATGRRWYEAAETMAANMTNYNQIAASTYGKTLPEVYAIGYNYTLYQAEQQAGFYTSFTMFDINTVERLIEETPDLLPQPKIDIPKDEAWNKKIIVSEVTQAILQGETIDQLANRLAVKCAGMNERAAVRNARTAYTSAENGGRMRGHKELTDAGIRMRKTWVATLDAVTRESHRWVDGETLDDPDAEFSNGLLYPGDPAGEPEEVYNCRCTMISTYKGVDPDIMRGSRSGTFRVGREYGDFRTTTYKEWKGEKRRQEEKQRERVNPDNPSYGYSGRNPATVYIDSEEPAKKRRKKK